MLKLKTKVKSIAKSKPNPSSLVLGYQGCNIRVRNRTGFRTRVHFLPDLGIGPDWQVTKSKMIRNGLRLESDSELIPAESTKMNFHKCYLGLPCYWCLLATYSHLKHRVGQSMILTPKIPVWSTCNCKIVPKKAFTRVTTLSNGRNRNWTWNRVR